MSLCALELFCSSNYMRWWCHIQEPGTLWIHSVPQEIVNSVSDAEKRRQEAINEVIYTERDFVRDMEYLRDVRHPSSFWFIFYLNSSDLDWASKRRRYHSLGSKSRLSRTGVLEYTWYHCGQYSTAWRSQQETEILCGRWEDWWHLAGCGSSFRTICLLWCPPALWEVRIWEGEELKSRICPVCRGLQNPCFILVKSL